MLKEDEQGQYIDAVKVKKFILRKKKVKCGRLLTYYECDRLQEKYMIKPVMRKKEFYD